MKVSFMLGYFEMGWNGTCKAREMVWGKVSRAQLVGVGCCLGRLKGVGKKWWSRGSGHWRVVMILMVLCDGGLVMTGNGGLGDWWQGLRMVIRIVDVEPARKIWFYCTIKSYFCYFYFFAPPNYKENMISF